MSAGTADKPFCILCLECATEPMHEFKSAADRAYWAMRHRAARGHERVWIGEKVAS